MEENLLQILVFKTNIQSDSDKQRMKEFFISHNHVQEVSVDTEDIDKVLRIVSSQLNAEEIITLVKAQGFSCSELE